MNSDQRFAKLAEALARDPDVTPPDASNRRFGSSALKVNGSIFAMHVGGRLVVKLPAERVASLIAEGSGAPFVSGKGASMREWVTVGETDDATWLELAREARAFVASTIKPKR